MIESKIIKNLLNHLKKIDDKERLLQEFWSEVEKKGTPIIEEYKEGYKLLTFLYRSNDLDNIVLFGGLNDLNLYSLTNRGIFSKIESTDIFYLTILVRDETYASYKLSINDSLILPFIDDPNLEERLQSLVIDPFNPNVFKTPKIEGIANENLLSIINLRQKPDTTGNKTSKVGTISENKLKSQIFEEHRTYWLYLPYNFDPKKKYSFLLIFDGEAYLNLIPTPKILDQMISDNIIPPVIGIFVSHWNRREELAMNSKFTQYIVEELIPDVKLDHDIDQGITIGSSIGGHCALYTAINYPELFPYVLSQSGSFWYKSEKEEEWEELTREIGKSEKKSIKRIWLDVGKLERVSFDRELDDILAFSPSLLTSNRHLRDVLTIKGYTVDYHEFEGGHEYISWKETLKLGLRSLIG